MTASEQAAAAALRAVLDKLTEAEALCITARCTGSQVVGGLEDARNALGYVLRVVEGRA